VKHIGWKIGFGISWIPALFIYGNFITGLVHINDKGTGGLAGGLTFLFLLPVVIIFLAVQSVFGWLAFRK
jgi:hypothetical protein